MTTTRPATPLILIVDDDPTTCALTSTILEREGWRTRCATGGREALAMIERETDVALVLLDVVMPEMDGFEVCGRLRASERGRKLPVILLTGRDDVDTRLEAVQSGVSEFLAKPFTRHELIARVRAQLHILELTRQLETVEQNLRSGASRPDDRA
jgi:DNA-binding response OmpR family regulator